MSEDRLTSLREAQANVSAAFTQAVPKGHKCGPISTTKEQWDGMNDAIAVEDAARAALMPTEQDAIRLISDAHERLKELGWNDIIYCPKDGSEFDAIEVGSTGIHRCHYSGEWPDGSWLIADEHDLYPSRPIMYRVTEQEIARLEAMRAKFQSMPSREEAP